MRSLQESVGMEVGIVMDDVRYTNFDVTKYWKTQTWRYTDFDDVPEGIADKLIIFPNDEQRNQVGSLVPNDFDVHISEDVDESSSQQGACVGFAGRTF